MASNLAQVFGAASCSSLARNRKPPASIVIVFISSGVKEGAAARGGAQEGGLSAGASGRPGGGNLLAQVGAERVVEDRGQHETDDERQVAELRIRVRERTVVDDAVVREDADGHDEADQHRDRALP